MHKLVIDTRSNSLPTLKCLMAFTTYTLIGYACYLKYCAHAVTPQFSSIFDNMLFNFVLYLAFLFIFFGIRASLMSLLQTKRASCVYTKFSPGICDELIYILLTYNFDYLSRIWQNFFFFLILRLQWQSTLYLFDFLAFFI